MAARWDYFMAADTQRISKPFHLVIEGACPDVGIVGEAPAEIGDKGFERIGGGPLADPDLALLG